MPFKSWLRREILVAAWLIVVVGFLWIRLPGFWRSPYERFVEAQRLAAAGQLLDADFEIGMAIDEDPHNAGYLTYRGYLHLQLGEASAAAESFRRALDEGAQAEAALGLAQALAGTPHEARAVLEGLDAASLDAAQRYRRLSLLASLGDFRAAVSDGEFIDGMADPAQTREALRWAMAAQDWPLAMRLADRVAADPPAPDDSRAALLEKAVAMRAAGQLAEALALYDELAGDDTLERRAQLALQLERFAQAAGLFEAVAERRPSDVEPRIALAYALEKAGRTNEAIEAYRAVAGDVGPEARITLATLLNSLRRHEDAWQALAPLPRPVTDREVTRLLARTAFWAGRLPEADALFAALRSPLAADVALETDLAQALGRAGRPGDADRVYRRLLDTGRLPRPGVVAFVDSLIERGRHDEAWQVLAAVSAPDADVIERRTRLAVWTRRWPEALPLLRAWLQGHPNDAGAWRDLAETARQRGDAAVELEALEASARLAPPDAIALLRRAGLLEQAGRIDEAIVAYGAALAVDPQRSDVLQTVGRLLGQRGRTAEAVRSYGQAWQLTTPGDPAIALTVARLQRARGEPADAAMWYERALRGRLDAASRRDLEVEHAWAQIEAGRFDDAAAHLQTVVEADARHEPALVAAASLETRRGRAGAAAGHLRRLRAARPLTTSERRWLAGQLRADGDLSGALAEYDLLLADGGPVSDEDLVATGDLRGALGDSAGALAAYRRVAAGPARASADLASARILARGGRFDESVLAYRRYLEAGSPDGLRLELARAHLGAQEFEPAERWAREAADSAAERGPIADAVLAEALHLRGHFRESRRVVDGLPTPLPQDPRLLDALAHLAASRDEHLRAIRLYTAALDRKPENPGELAYWRGRSAARRGDPGRALADFDRARAAGAVPELEQRARVEARFASAPALAAPASASDDSNGLSSVLGGVAADVWVGRRLPVSFEALGGVLSQRSTSFARTRTLIGTPDARVRPDLSLQAQAGAETYGNGSRRLVGSGGATYFFEGRSALRVAAWQDSLWAMRDRREMRQFNRGVDLAALGPDFRTRGAEMVLDTASGDRNMARLQLGGDWFGDGNRRQAVYGHYQFTVEDRPGRWTGLRPNVQWERFSRPSPSYFSPDSHLALGAAWHTQRQTTNWRLEAEVNPRLTWLRADPNAGAYAAVDMSRRLGEATAGIGGFAFYDRRTDYWSWRAVAQVGIRLGQ